MHAADSEVGDPSVSTEAAMPPRSPAKNAPDEQWRVRLEVRVSLARYFSGVAGPAWGPEP